jgi:hypothetical protein
MLDEVRENMINDVDFEYEVFGDLDLKFQIYDMREPDNLSKAVFIIQETAPHFRVYDKLCTIWDYEQKHVKENQRIAVKGDFEWSDFLIAEHLENKPIDTIKNLIDRRYVKAKAMGRKKSPETEAER